MRSRHPHGSPKPAAASAFASDFSALVDGAERKTPAERQLLVFLATSTRLAQMGLPVFAAASG